jgi:hypothetical protein
LVSQLDLLTGQVGLVHSSVIHLEQEQCGEYPMSHLKSMTALKGALVALLLVVGAAATSSVAASEAPPQITEHSGDDPLGIESYIPTADQLKQVSSKVLEQNQELIDQLADKVRSLDEAGHGLSGIVTNPATGTFTVWWSGEPPAQLKDLAGKSESIVFEIREGGWPREDLLARVQDVFFPASGDRPLGEGTVSVRQDGTAVVASPVSADWFTDEMDANREVLAKRMGVPIIWVLGNPSFSAANRQNDNMRGGVGALIGPDNDLGYCSIGFAVLDGPYGRLLSAAHCNTGGNRRWQTGNGNGLIVPPNSNAPVVLGADSILLDPVDGTRGKVYKGGYFGQDVRSVVGTAVNNVGDVVCTSGANTGQHCDLTVIDDSVSQTCVDGYSYTCVNIAARAPVGERALAQGDSGGPVYTTNGNDARARGIISRTSNDGCAGMPIYTKDELGWATPICGRIAYYRPIRPLLDIWNVQIETS